MRLCVSERAAADCVQLGVHIDDVQSRVRRRGTTKIRLKGNERVKVTVIKHVIVRVRHAVGITPEAVAQANAAGLDSSGLLRILATPRQPGGVHNTGNGIDVVVKSVNGGEVVAAVIDHRISGAAPT